MNWLKALGARLMHGQGGMVEMVIGIVVVLLVMALILPIALTQWFAVTYSGFGSGLVALWPVIPLIAIVGIVIYLIRRAGSSAGG